MSSTTNSIFTGNSQFANDFQQVITRAVSLASLPMQAMQSQVSKLQSQSSELSTLSGSFASLQSSISNLESALGTGSYAAVSSDNSVASASLSGTPSPGTYTIEVDDVGAHATAMSSDGLAPVTDPAQSSISTASSYTLTVGTAQYSITPATNTLSALADAINQNPATSVQATVVNVGTSRSPDYRLSLQGTKLGDLPIQLQSTVPLLTAGVPGSPVTYRVDGKPASPADPLSSDSNTIQVAPGLSVNLLATGTTTITVSQGTTAINQALAGFASAYNSAQAEINKNRGQSAGALQGQSILTALTQTLHKISGYSNGSSGISSLTVLGLRFDDKGVLSLDSSAFASAAAGNIAQLTSFFGSPTGGGFIKTANDALKAVTDSARGSLPSGISALEDQITKGNTAISGQQDRINTLQTNLNRQMAAADAAIASMEQQYTYLSNMFTAMQLNAKNGG